MDDLGWAIIVFVFVLVSGIGSMWNDWIKLEHERIRCEQAQK